MFSDRVEAKWIDMFCQVFGLCKVKEGDTAAIEMFPSERGGEQAGAGGP